METLVPAGERSAFAARSEGMADSGQLVAVGAGSAQDSGGAHEDVWPHRVPEAGVTAWGRNTSARKQLVRPTTTT